MSDPMSASLFVIGCYWPRRHNWRLSIIPENQGKIRSLATIGTHRNDQNREYAGLHKKLLKPLAQGASRFEKLLARKKVTGPKKSPAQIL